MAQSLTDETVITDDVQKVFQKFDRNGDGKISVAEMEAIMNSLGSKTSTEEVQRMMKELDVNGDGSIDLKEFAAFQFGGDASNNDDELHEAFDLYDKDKNGKISASELHAVLRSLGEKVTLEDSRRMISSVDVDGDGCVNFDEFKKMMNR